ncbi:MAG: spermidine/putrescine ABC transporter substrate-binding protein [Actinomycetota bacterium]|nr:spermidine/putrescine ABC transporter substrate-binding protein [Actinomycetota bacterium]
MKRLLILLAVVAMLAAACSSSSDETTTTAAGGTDETTTTAPVEAESDLQAAVNACQPGETDGDLNFYNWTEYIPYGSAAEDFEVTDLVAKFEEEYDVKIVQTFYEDNETMLAQIEAGGAPYDLIVPSDYMVSTMADPEVGLLVKFNPDAIPNLVNLDPLFDNAPYDPTGEYSVPYQAGTSGLGFTYAALDEAGVDYEDGLSWGLVFDPEMSEPFTGMISMLNDERETLGAVLKYLGYSVNTTDQAELDEATAVLKTANDRIAAYDSAAFDDLLMTGETVVAHGWNGGFLGSYDQASTDDYDAYEEFGYAVPNEGGIVWVDLMAVPVTAEHPCTAHTFINFILDAENGGELTNYTYYMSPNLAAYEYIYPEILEDEMVFPSEETMANLEFIADVGEFSTKYTDAFAEAKG